MTRPLRAKLGWTGSWVGDRRDKVTHWMDHETLDPYCQQSSTVVPKMTVRRDEVTCKNCVKKWLSE